MQKEELMINDCAIFKGKNVVIKEISDGACTVQFTDAYDAIAPYEELQPCPLSDALLAQWGFSTYEKNLTYNVNNKTFALPVNIKRYDSASIRVIISSDGNSTNVHIRPYRKGSTIRYVTQQLHAHTLQHLCRMLGLELR